ncbi:hypothetical protein LCGC14_2821670 [marine sediment metagenome]|uniref:Zinc-ribbon domain-containing protein n=1 Tax=marine sediment metagenome TaxID=412755 RepID=A0A0F9AQ70_9ZZZZ
MRNKAGIVLLIIGGILMIISSAVGSIGIYEFLYDLISTEIPVNLIPLLNILLNILRFIADMGGGAIMIGAFLIMGNLLRFGKWLIGVGLTFGTLALVIWLISQIVNVTGVITDPQILGYFTRLEGFFTYNTGFQFIGVVITIIGRNAIKKPKEAEEEKGGQAKISEDIETSKSIAQTTSENKNCPNCGSQLPLNANYCNECGSSFENR